MHKNNFIDRCNHINTGMTMTHHSHKSLTAHLMLLAILLPISQTTFADDASPSMDNSTPDRGALRLPARNLGSKLVIRSLAAPVPEAAPMVEVPEFQLEEITKRKFSLQGLSIGQEANIDQRKMNEVMTPWLNRELTFAEFQEASQALADHLRANGHPNAEVKISQMQFKQGQVGIAIAGLTPPVVPTEPKLAVRDIKVTGATVISDAELKKALVPYFGRDLTVKEIGDATEAVSGALRNKGYALAQAYLPLQKIEDGVVTIAVQEGIVDGTAGKGGVTVTGGGDTIKPEIVEGYLAQGVQANKPLNVATLERSLRIANELPGVESITTNLAPGNEPGTTQVLAEVKSGKPVTGSLSADNFGNPFMGEGRLNAAVNVNSPSGNGEQYFVNLSKAVSMSSYKIGGHTPVGYSGLRMGASYSSMHIDVGGSVALTALGLSSDSDIASVFANYPLERSATRNTYLSASLDNKHYKTLSNTGSNASSINNDRVINGLSMGASGDWSGDWNGRLGWGVNLTAASVDLSGNTDYRDKYDATNARTQGGFNKLNASLNHLQTITNDWYLYTSLSAQYADKNLDSAEKFQLGGPFGVRAYPVGEGLGDQGWLATAEVRHNAGTTQFGDIELFGFADTGGVTQYLTPWSNAFSGKGNANSYQLSGYGLGLGITYQNSANVRVMVAEKMGTNPNQTVDVLTGKTSDSDGKSDNTRVWVVGTIVF
jgi:hemolysin activation/secretion protein